jgi:hypothetical protein
MNKIFVSYLVSISRYHHFLLLTLLFEEQLTGKQLIFATYAAAICLSSGTAMQQKQVRTTVTVP